MSTITEMNIDRPGLFFCGHWAFFHDLTETYSHFSYFSGNDDNTNWTVRRIFETLFLTFDIA